MKKLILISALLLCSNGWADQIFFECHDKMTNYQLNKDKTDVRIVEESHKRLIKYTIDKETNEYFAEHTPYIYSDGSRLKGSPDYGKVIWTADYATFKSDQFNTIMNAINRESLLHVNGGDVSLVKGTCEIVEKKNKF